MKNKVLSNIAKHLGMKFPIAGFANDLGYSKGIVSEYYNNKKEISDKFIEKIEEVYNIKFIDFIEDNLSNNDYLKKMIEKEALEILEKIPNNKILSYIVLKEREFQEDVSFVSFIESQKVIIDSRKLAKDI